MNEATEFAKEREIVRAEIEKVVTLLTDSETPIAVSCVIGDRTTIFKIECPQEYIGKVLGGQGRTIAALRTVFSAITARFGFRSVLELPYYKNDRGQS